jgi:NADH:ubiquinone oxidoreductase subunit H
MEYQLEKLGIRKENPTQPVGLGIGSGVERIEGIEWIEKKINIINSIEIIIPILISIAYITLAERKIMGRMQRRIGPNKVGIIGIIQPIVDGIKLISKEIIIPQRVQIFEMLIGPFIILTLCLIIWIPIPIDLGIMIKENKYSILYILAISSLNVYLYIYSGWSTISKYAYIGSLRSISQLISYEVSIGIIFMCIIYLNNSFNFNDLLLFQIFSPNIFPLFPIASLFFISILAETNRPPFDLPEAESELIAGYLIEYGGFAFASIYLAEYGFILIMSFLFSILFFGFFLSFFSLFLIFFFIWIRATLPRIRYDHLLSLGWTNILPFSISYLIFISSFLFLIN